MSAGRIIRFVAERYDVHPSVVLGRTVTKTAAAARRHAMYLIRKQLDWSYPEIGAYFNRDHKTVMHAVKRMDEVMLTAPGGVYP